MKENRNDIITVKALRELLGYTQEEFAKLIDTSQDYISKLEHSSKTLDALSARMLLNISKITNESIDNLLNNKILNNNSFIMNDIYSGSSLAKLNEKKDIYFGDYTLNHIDNFLTIMAPHINKSYKNESYTLHINEFNKKVTFDFEKIKRKPIIAVFGARASGKSSIVNSILGKNLLPISIYSTVNYTIHFKDIKDKPNYIKEDFLVFEISNKTRYKIDPNVLLSERVYSNKKFINHSDSIIIECKKQYVSVQQCYENNKTSNEIYIINFVSNVPILKNTDIIDTVGVDRSTNVNSDNKYNNAIDIPKQKNRELLFSPLYIPLYICDIAICLFEHFLYLKDNDIEILRIIKDNKSSDKLMIVASKADINNYNKNSIITTISKNTNCEESMCSTYSVKSDRKDLRERFEKQLEAKIKKTIDYKNSLINENFSDNIKKYINKNIKNTNDIIFNYCVEQTKKDFENYYNFLLRIKKTKDTNIKTFLKIIKERKVKRKQEDIYNLCDELNNNLLTNLKSQINKYCLKLISNKENIDIENAFYKYLSDIFNMKINMYTSQSYLDILNKIRILDNKSISQFSSKQIIQIYTKNKFLEKNDKAIEQFWEYVKEFIKSIKEV